MTRNVFIGKTAIPLWLVVIALAGIGAGAAAGTILAGKVTGLVPVAVSQAVLVGEPTNDDTVDDVDMEIEYATQQIKDNIENIEPANRFIGVKSDDNTSFQAAMELSVGDWTEIQLPIMNVSHNNSYALLTLDIPAGLEVEVWSDEDTSAVQSVMRVGPNTWKFMVFGDMTGTGEYLRIVVSIDDETMPGYFSITGTIKQTAV